MLFKDQNFYVDLIQNKDLNKVAKVYNSNRHLIILFFIFGIKMDSLNLKT